MFRATVLTILWLCAGCGSANDPVRSYKNTAASYKTKVILAYEVKRENLKNIASRFHIPLNILERFNPREGGRRKNVIYVPITHTAALRKGEGAPKIVKLMRDSFLRPVSLGDWSAVEEEAFETLDDWFVPEEAQRLSFPVEGYISSGYSWRWNRFHKGIDIAARLGSPIVAAQDGYVSFRGWKAGFGLLVVVEHREGRSYYAHCQSAKVKVGQKVSRGDLIARVGATGHARGPHLHFEFRDNLNQPLDPTPFLMPPCTRPVTLSAQPVANGWAAKAALCQNSDI